jgi:hypothetical protein
MEPPVIVHLSGMVYSGDTMKRLYGTTDATEAETLRALLKEAGIDSTFDPEGLGIHVRDEDAPKAAEVLAAHFEKQDPREATPPPEEEKPAGWLSRLIQRMTGKKKGSAPR